MTGELISHANSHTASTDANLDSRLSWLCSRPFGKCPPEVFSKTRCCCVGLLAGWTLDTNRLLIVIDKLLFYEQIDCPVCY